MLTLSKENNLWMKKNVLFICFIALVSLGMASLSIFPEKVSLPITFGGLAPNAPDQSTKYSDCIDSLDLSRLMIKHAVNYNEDTAPFMELDTSLEKYGKSMDSVVDNLNALEAHQFLHAAYKKYREILQSDSLSIAEAYYHLEAMKICYNLDQSLSLNSEGLAKNAK